MNKGIMATGILLLAIIAYGMVNVIQNYSTGNEMDYYLLKETTEASMTDAVDVDFYRIYGQIRMDKEKFAESFTRRLAANIGLLNTYNFEIYDINETPPKVSVVVYNNTAVSYAGATGSMYNTLDAIIETTYNTDYVYSALRKLEDTKKIDDSI